MSRITKWKLEKSKVKVVFRLQFHATHIPLSGWDKLFISFIPCETGKATAKTTKANVRNGTCKWADPIYETTRLLQDAKSKQYDEKLYKIVVALGSSRASILGEATINLADYADALKPSAISLPLHGCNSGTILHVTVQLLSSKTGFREFEQQREQREKGLESGSESKHYDTGPSKDIASDHLEKVNARVRFRDAKELSSLEEVSSHEEHGDSALGYDDSSNTSESLYAEKHDSSSAHEIDSLRSTTSGDLNGLRNTEKGDPSDDRIMGQGTSDSAHGWASDYSVDNDLAMVYEENHKLRGGLELAESTILELKQEITSLQMQANEIGTKTQKFSHFLASEISSGEVIAKEVSFLKSECSKFKDDIERLRFIKMNPQVIGRENNHSEHDHLLQDKMLRWINGIMSAENKVRELQNKTFLGFHESDFRSFHSELEDLLRILHDIRRGAGEVVSSGTELDLDLSLPESLLQNLSIPPLVSQETDSMGAIDAMKSKILDLTRELDEVKTERENFARKMDHMECYYEALIQELEENHKQMMGELQNLRNEHSICLYTISTNKAEMESMCQDMNQKLLTLAEERRDLDELNKELEKRASTSEAALRRAHLNYSIAVDKLQKDLELLSAQVVSMFETNENLIKQAFSESAHEQILGSLHASENTENCEAVSLLHCQKLRIQSPGGDILLEDLKRSLYLQEELYQKVEEELQEMQLVNLYLDIFSTTLKETLLEADADIGYMKENFDEVVKHLELSNGAQDQLIMRLQTAMEDIHILNNYKTSCIAKFNDIAQQNKTLEAKLEIVTEENGLLSQKVAEFEAIVSENSSYQMKYEACCAEKFELSKLLKQENAENVELLNDISLLKEELKMAEAKIHELSLLKNNLQERVDFVHNKLASMSVSYEQQFKGLNLVSDFHFHDVEFDSFKDAILQLEELQVNSCNKILELMEENKNLDGARVLSETSLSTARSEVLSLKQEFKSDMQKMAAKLALSNALVEKLQFNLESVSNKLELSSEVEENHFQKNKEFLVDLALFEVEIQKLTSIGALDLKDLADELVTSKSSIAELVDEKQHLLESLQDKIQESVKLASDRDSLIENVENLNNKLELESIDKEKLEGTVRDLSSQLNEMQEKLIECDQQHAELVHFRQLSLELEREKSRLNSLLLQHDESLEKLNNESSCVIRLQTQLDECLEKLRNESSCVIRLQTQLDECLEKLQNESSRVIRLQTQLDECLEKLQNESSHVLHLQTQLDECLEKLHHESSCVINLQTQLLEMEEYSLAADVKSIFLLNQHENFRNEFFRHTELSAGCFEELQKRHHEVEAKLNECLVSEARYKEENAQLITTLEALRSDLDTSVTQSKFSSDENSFIRAQFEECKEKFEALQALYIKDKDQYALQIEKQKTMLADAEKASEVCLEELQKRHHEVEVTLNQCLVSEARYKEENAQLIVTVESLRSDLDASVAQSNFSSDANDVLRVQFDECKEKFEALQALYIKDKDQYAVHIEKQKTVLVNAEKEIDCLMLSNAELEITIIVLKEKLDEQSASVSMMEEYKEDKVILQSRCNELARKLSEQVLKTEEFKNLSIHLKELKDKAEAEARMAHEKKEPEGPPVMQDSLRIAFIKEQYETKVQEMKQQLLMSRKHGEELLLKLQDALDEIESRKKSEAFSMRTNEELSLKLVEMEADLKSALSEKCEKMNAYDNLKAELDCAVLTLECCKEEKEKIESSVRECEEEKNKIAVELNRTKGQLESAALSIKIQKGENARMKKAGDVQGAATTAKDFSVNGDTLPGADLQETDETSLSNAHLNTMNLRSSMEHLHDELEKMKNENHVLPNDHHVDPELQVLQGELMRLHNANNQLRDMFPSFDDISSGGNALERVLALEIELAESLTAKSKSKFQFQSSFLKQHSDEEALLKSIRDINELIKEMLELKGKYAAVENELKEMHDRYSQLSLQYAEVEGERQKLKMTLKNVRGSRKVIHLNRSSSDTLTDQSP